MKPTYITPLAVALLATGALAGRSLVADDKQPEAPQAAAPATGGQTASTIDPDRKPGLGQPSFKRQEGEVTSKQKVVVRKKVEIPTVRITEEKADLNRMEFQHFKAVGVPSQIAQNILDYRDEIGIFRSVDQLRNVPGMSDEVFAKLKMKAAAVPPA